MKYALIRMHITSTMSANLQLLERHQVSPLVSLPVRARERPFTLFCMEIRSVVALSHGAAHQPRARRAWSEIADLRLLQRFERLRDELAAFLEPALGRVEVSRPGAAL